jgi:DNA polymerase-1
MVQAYLIGNVPQRLKYLAWRECGIPMREYRDVIAPYQDAKMRAWLDQATGIDDWPAREPKRRWSPEPEYRQDVTTTLVSCTARKKDARQVGDEWVYEKTRRGEKYLVPGTENGHWRMTNPWAVGRTLQRFIADVALPEEAEDEAIEALPVDDSIDDEVVQSGDDAMVNDTMLDDDVGLRRKWLAKEADLRAIVEARLGPPPQAWLSDVPREEAVSYSALDADATLQVHAALQAKIDELELNRCLDIELRMIPMIRSMMDTGMLIDLGRWEQLRVDFTVKRVAIEQGFVDELASRGVTHQFNMGSNDCMANVLYGDLGLPCTAQTKDGRMSVKGDVLKKLRLSTQDPAVNLLLQHRQYSKLMQAFILPMPDLVGLDGRVHPRIKTTRTATGRLAFAKPNLTQIPSRSDEATAVKAAFIASPGRLLVGADYSSIEPRALTHLSNDPTALAIYKGEKGVEYEYKIRTDIYRWIASFAWGVPLDKVDKHSQRDPAKTLLLADMYGQSVESLVDQLATRGLTDYTQADAEWLKAKIAEFLPGFGAWFDLRKTEIMQTGIAREECLGRIRRIPQAFSNLRGVKNEGLRQGGNMLIQAFAQGVIKIAMVNLWEKVPEVTNGVAWPLFQQHDSLYFDVLEDQAEAFSLVLKDVMENAYPLSIPTPVEVKIGKNWAEA